MTSDVAQVMPRIWKRLGRVPSLHSTIERLNDWSRASLFRLQFRQRKALFDEYKKCRGSAEYFSLVSHIPNTSPYQIKSEIVGLLDFVIQRSPVNVCEIGTADGGTNFLLSQAVPSVKFMLGIDLFVRNTHLLRYFSRSDQQKLHYLNASSYATETIDKVRCLLAGEKLDLLFIDGDHTYAGVKKDFIGYREFVREGGLIAFHDIIPDYMTQYGRKTARWVGDVPLFWQKLKPYYPNYEFIHDREQDGLGIGCIEYHATVQLPTDF